MEYTTFIIAIDVPKEALKQLHIERPLHEIEIASLIAIQISERHGFKVIGSL